MVIIERIGKRIGIDLTYVIKNGLFLYSASITSTVLKTFLAFALLTYLSVRDYGIYNFIFSVIGVLAVTSVPGISEALSRHVAKTGRKYEWGYFLKRVRWSFIGSMCILVVAGYTNYIAGDSRIAFLLVVCAFLFPLYKSSDIVQSFLSGTESFKKQSIYSIISCICINVSLIILAFVYGSAEFLVLGMIIITIVLNLLYMFFEEKEKEPTIEKDVISYGMNLSLSSIIGSVSTHFDKLLLAFLLGVEALAIFSASKIFLELSKSFIKSSLPIFIPKFSRMKQHSFVKLMKRTLLPVFLLSIFVGAIFYFAIPVAFSLFKEDYLVAVPYAQFLLLAIPPLAITFLFNQFLRAQARMKEIYTFEFSGSILNILLLLVLVFFYGIKGAVFAIVLQRYSIMFLSMYLVLKSTWASETRTLDQ